MDAAGASTDTKDRKTALDALRLSFWIIGYAVLLTSFRSLQYLALGRLRKTARPAQSGPKVA